MECTLVVYDVEEWRFEVENGNEPLLVGMYV